MNERPLDLDTVKAFIRIAELGSFTLAADSLRMTQAAVSLKLKRLEDRLGFRLVERTPRHVELSARGAGFLEHAWELMAAHERALALSVETRQRLTIGISDHVAGPSCCADRAHERAGSRTPDRNPHRLPRATCCKAATGGSWTP